MAFLVSLDQTGWRVLRGLCGPRPPASHPTLAETKILSHFSLQILHSYIFQPITPERIWTWRPIQQHNPNSSAGTVKCSESEHECLSVEFFTERLKFQCVCLPLTAVQSTVALFSKKNEAIHQLRIYSKISPSWGRARITKPWCHSDRNDPLDSGTAHPSWLISSQPVSQHLPLFQTQQLDRCGQSHI